MPLAPNSTREDFPGVIPLHGIVPENQGPLGIAYFAGFPLGIINLPARKIGENGTLATTAAAHAYDHATPPLELILPSPNLREHRHRIGAGEADAGGD